MKPLPFKILLTTAAIVIPLLFGANSVSILLAQHDEIKIGDIIEGELTTDAAVYDFVTEAGSWVKISVEATDFEPVLSIVDGDGKSLAVDDPYSGISSTGLLFSASHSGTYILNISSIDPGGGKFTLRVAPLDATSLKAGEIASITFNEPERYFLFDAAQSDAFDISVNTLATSPSSSGYNMMFVLTADAQTLAVTDDDGSFGILTFNRLTVPATGSYVLVVMSPSGQAIIGDVSVTLKPVETLALTLSDQPQTVVLHKNLPQDTFTFEAKEAGSYRLTVTVDDGTSRNPSGATFAIELQQNGVNLTSAGMSGLEGTLDFAVTNPGAIRVNLSSLVEQATRFSVSVSTASAE
ncbi:MAG TPA: hypothetical protein VHL11_12400 [Phototrophicaceae bacterium]|jgi:hypothetical protein|nr:hypothetical protein [Phototrophicaceae bacterium]